MLGRLLPLALLLAGFSTACKDDSPPAASQPPVAAACLEQPTDLPRPPSSGLPCELLPPDFQKK